MADRGTGRLVYSTGAGRICPGCGWPARDCKCSKTTDQPVPAPDRREAAHGEEGARRQDRHRRGLVGAYLFGLFSSLGFVLQAREVHLPPEVFLSLPYVMTVVVLVVVSTGWAKQRLGAPAALGTPYIREER